MDHVFLDANILFSAAWRADVSPGLTLWTLEDTVLVSSAFAIAEAERNLTTPEQRTRLYRLIRSIEIVDEPPAGARLPNEIRLPRDMEYFIEPDEALVPRGRTGDLGE